MQQVADVLQVNMEKVRPDLPQLYESVYKDTAYSMLQKGAEKYRISKTPNGTDFRIPLIIQPPGVYAKLDLDGGAFAAGSGFVTKQMYQTYFTTQLAIQMSLESIKSTDQSSLSVVNVWKENMRQALPNYMRYNDVSFHNITGNQGLIAHATNYTLSSATAGTYTFDYEFGANLLQVGQRVAIFPNALSTPYTTGIAPGSLPLVETINKQANTAYISAIPTSTAQNTDYIALAGVADTPAWMNGLYYFQDASTSATTLGLARSTYQELIPPSFNAAGALTPLAGTLLKARIRQRTGEYPKKLKGLMADAQAAQVVSLGISISEWQRGKSDQAIDPVPGYGEHITFSQVDHLIDIHASKKRIEWLNTDYWGRVYMIEPDFYKEPGTGRMVFDVRNSSGAVLTAIQYFLYCSENFYNVRPAASGFIYGLTVDSNFQ